MIHQYKRRVTIR